MQAVQRFQEVFARVNGAICGAGIRIASVLVALMVLIVIVGVFFRYVLNDSISWVEDVALIMMATTAFLVAPHAYRSGANVAIGITAALPPLLTGLLRLLVNMLILWIVCRYFLESLTLVQRGWFIRVNTVPIAWAWPYMIVPGAFAAMALVAMELIVRDIRALSGSGSGDTGDTGDTGSAGGGSRERAGEEPGRTAGREAH